MAKQKNAPKGGENFKVAPAGSGDSGQGGRGKVSQTIGPMNAHKISNGGSLRNEHVGPKNAPYYDKGSV